RPPQRLDDLVSPALLRSEVDEEHLVFAVVNNLGELGLEAYALAPAQVAAEHRQLQVLASASHELENRAKAIRVADIVGHEVHRAHGSPRQEGWIFRDLTEQESAQ